MHPQSKTIMGLWVLREPCISLPQDCTNEELGNAVLSSLKTSQQGVPHPDKSEFKSLAEPLLKAAGVKSWRAFSNGAEQISVDQNGEAISFTPMRNMGSKQGFVEHTKERINVTSDRAADVGEAVRKVFSNIK